MSRIGKKPILIPAGVEVSVNGDEVVVKGPKGELKKKFMPDVKVELKNDDGDKLVAVSPAFDGKRTAALWGLTRALIANMIKGVQAGFEKKLQIEGVGYKANIEGDGLVLSLGFSHPIKLKQEPGIKFSVEKNIVTISGTDKEQVGQIAAKIRKIKPPEPYKGKGIRYLGEYVRRKAGKKAVATEK